VSEQPGGAYAALFGTNKIDDVDALQERLTKAVPVFRRVMAEELTRKRLPPVSFLVVPLVAARTDEEVRDA
jgi:hypothetical protein